MSAGEPPHPEHILCDTSFVSIKQAAGSDPAVSHTGPAKLSNGWIVRFLRSVSSALRNSGPGKLALNGIQTRSSGANRVTDAYLRVPLDLEVSERWGFLRATARAKGRSIGDNDLWIAATAQSREWPLVSCDKHFNTLPDLEHIHLPRHLDSKVAK